MESGLKGEEMSVWSKITVGDVNEVIGVKRVKPSEDNFLSLQKRKSHRGQTRKEADATLWSMRLPASSLTLIAGR